jgi:2-methylaconitate cis-trans-isomerase PrpF
VSAAARSGTLPAVFMRGGTSKALMLHRRDVPGDLAAREPVFLSTMDSPDPFGRQPNGLGGGVSSVSKTCVVERSARPDADIDDTFLQVVVGDGWRVARGAFVRTARPLMRGTVFDDAPPPV